MTLKEFVKAFMEANNDTRDVDEMCKLISEEASRKQNRFTADEMQPAEQDLDEIKRRLFGEEQEDGSR